MSSNETTFSAGRTYWTRSVCDHDCVWQFTIVRRTARNVWFRAGTDSEVQRRGITTESGREFFFPFGRYSMAAIVSSDRVVAEELAQ